MSDGYSGRCHLPRVRKGRGTPVPSPERGEPGQEGLATSTWSFSDYISWKSSPRAVGVTFPGVRDKPRSIKPTCEMKTEARPDRDGFWLQPMTLKG